MPQRTSNKKSRSAKKDRIKIMIVDDDEGILKAVSLFLEVEGYEVAVRENARFMDEVSSLTAEKPDLILLDMLLSGADGRVLCKKLKSQVHTKKIPIIIFSAHPTAEKTVKSAGADAFVGKPFDTRELLMKIKKFTDK